MTQQLLQILILVVVVGGLLYILSILPIDQTIKTIGRVVIVIIAAVYAISMIAPMLDAQVRRGNPLEDYLYGLENRQGNSTVSCNVQHRLQRNGDIRWIRIECTDNRRYGR